jgi:hypothetical protein
MATITSLSTLAKTSVGATDYLLIANSTVPTNYKLLTQDLFPTVTTLGTSSEALFVSITNKNTLNFKGIKSLDALLTVATASDNITLQVNPASINLALCNNATSQFISGLVSLTTGISGTLPVANGGTGLATLTSNSLYVGNGTSALTALGAATNGQIPIGRTGLSPILANLTAGSNVTITNGSGTITIAANLSTLTANLNASTFNIYGASWISGDGGNEGIAINAAGKVFIGSSTPTAFFNYDLNVNQGVGFNGSVIQRLEMSSSSTPAALGIYGAAASVSNVAGGGLVMEGGVASGTGAGGGIAISGGDAAGSGAGGSITIDPGTSGSGTGGKTNINATGTAGPLINFGGSTGAASANSVSSSVASAAAKTGAIRVQINGVDAWIRVYATAE